MNTSTFLMLHEMYFILVGLPAIYSNYMFTLNTAILFKYEIKLFVNMNIA